MRRLNSLLLSNVLWNGKLEEIFLSAESKEDRNRWMKAISQAIANIKAWGDLCRSTEKIVQPTHQSKLFKSIRSYGDVTSVSEKQESDNLHTIKQNSATDANNINNYNNKTTKVSPKKTRVRVRQHVSVEIIPADKSDSNFISTSDRPHHIREERHREDKKSSNMRVCQQITPSHDSRLPDSHRHRRMIAERREHKTAHLPCSAYNQKRSFDECSSPRATASPHHVIKATPREDKRPKLVAQNGTPRRQKLVARKASWSELENI